MTKDEEILLRELAGGRCTIQKVTDAIGPMSLWSKDGLEAEIRRAVEAELEHEIKRMREEMKIKSVTMRCKDYDVALPIIYNDFGRVLVGQVSITPKPKEPEQEPVTWMDDYNACKCSDNETRCFSDRVFRMMQKYTAPPQRTWVGLTDIEWMNIVNKDQAWFGQRTDEVAHEVAKLVEARLKGKNT
jgi:hypothetical protein